MNDDINWLDFFNHRERQHANFYLDFAQQHAHREPTAYQNLEAETGNLLKTATWLAEQHQPNDILQLATALWQKSDFMRTRGFLQRGLPLLKQAHQAARELSNPTAEFIWLEAMAQIHLNTGNPTAAHPLYEQALTLAQANDELLLKAQAELGLGRLLMEMAQLEQAAVWLKQALTHYRQSQAYDGEIETLVALGNLLSLQGNFGEAISYLEQGLPLTQTRQDKHGEMSLRYALGYVDGISQNWAMAIKHDEIAIELARETGDCVIEARGFINLAEAWIALGEAEKAISILEKSLACQETIDDTLTKAFTHFCLAKAYHALHDAPNSLSQLSYVYPLRQVPLMIPFVAEAAWLEADNYFQQGRFEEARAAVQDCLNLAPASLVEIRQQAENLLKELDS